MRVKQSITNAALFVLAIATSGGLVVKSAESEVPSGIDIVLAQKGLNGTLSKSAKELGHHGTVVISVKIGTDGNVLDSSIKKSSRSPILDEGARLALMKLTFSPDKDELGNYREFTGEIPIQFSNFRSVLAGTYTCRQANADTDWYLKNFSESSVLKSELALGIQSLGVILGQRDFSFAKEPDTFQSVWDRAIAACRAKPDALFAATILASRKK